jgi:regulator of RNase E activity RraA
MRQANTVQVTDVNRIPKKPYELQIQALDSIKEGEVFVASVSGSQKLAFFGEIGYMPNNTESYSTVLVNDLGQ